MPQIRSCRLASRWHFDQLSESEDNTTISHLHDIKAQWASSRLRIPDEWVVGHSETGFYLEAIFNLTPFKGENSVESIFTPLYQTRRSSHVVEVLRRIRHIITPLPMPKQESRFAKYTGPEPDFLAMASLGHDPNDGVPPTESLYLNSWPNFQRLRFVFKYPSLSCSADPEDTPGLITSQLCDFLQEYPGFILRTWVSSYEFAI